MRKSEGDGSIANNVKGIGSVIVELLIDEGAASVQQTILVPALLSHVNEHHAFCGVLEVRSNISIPLCVLGWV